MLQYSSPQTYTKTTRFIANGFTPEEREQLITAHLPKVKYIADRMSAKLPPSIERDDLYGAGVIGLIDAVERFDASRGIAFTTFAEMRVRGAILDNLRSLDWASRSTRRRAREIEKVFSQLEQEKGRAATEDEVAERMKIPLAELRENLQDLRGLSITGLDDHEEENGLSLLDTVCDKGASPLEKVEESERRRLLAKAIDKLPERERQVIALYYVEELNMKEIGEIMNVSESRVSQLRTQAIVRLRANLSQSVR
jgi:RNA polymerase sigma factor FliA